jgi:hypothetical protein
MPAAAGLAGLVVVVIVISVIYWWVTSFISLMCLTDGDMPGRYDKVLWFVVFLSLSVFAPLLFSMWRRAHQESRKT